MKVKIDMDESSVNSFAYGNNVAATLQREDFHKQQKYQKLFLWLAQNSHSEEAITDEGREKQIEEFINGNDQLLVYMLRYMKVKQKADGMNLELDYEKPLVSVKQAFMRPKNSHTANLKQSFMNSYVANTTTHSEKAEDFQVVVYDIPEVY